MSKTLRCVVIDDEPLAIALIKTYIEVSPTLSYLNDFEDAIAAAEYLNLNQVDLLFLDINMPDISGIDLYRSLVNKPMVIFTTAYKNYAYDGFELNAIDYLLKPIEYIRFKKAVNKAFEYYQHQNKIEVDHDESIFVHSEYKLVKISLKNILYLESLEDYVKIHMVDDTMVLTLMPLKKMIEKLPSDKFKRIHRSFVVSVANVKSVLNRKAKLSSGQELPISDTYVNFISDWKKY
jgi:two-component system LytT family response regulator